MNTYRQRVLSGLLCLIGALGAAQTYAQLLTVQADPLTVSSDERGRMAVWYEGTSQYYNINEKGSFLVLNDAGIRVNSFGSDLGTYPVFDAVAHSMPDSNTIETVFSPGADTGVRVHQRITCYDAARYYRITWTLTNSGATTYTDCRFLHGGDTDFGPGNISRGNWEPTRGMVFMSSTNYETTGIMGLFGGAASPSAHYHEAAWWPNWTALLMAILPDTVDPDMDDSGYGLQWNRATLAPGDSWTIDMYEKWTPPGAVQVFGPGEQACRLDTVQTNIFIVANYRDSADTFNLDVTSSLGWDLAIPGTTTVLLQAQSTTTIVTTVTVPTSLPSGRTVHFSTLHARSQGEPSLSNSDHVVSFMHIPHAPTAVNDTLCLPKGGIMDVLADGQHSLLDNDLDPEAHGLAAQDAAFNGPLHGSVDIFSDGTFLYTHNNDDAIADSFDYVAYDQQIPRLASTGHVEVSIMTVQPDNGPKAGRNVVAITGGYLGSGGDINAVSLNGFTAPIIRQSATQVIVRASYATVTGTGDVVVTSISKGTKRLRNAYTYNPPGTIFSVEPHHGPYNGGNTVTITGEALGNGTDVTNVLLCNVPAVIVDQSPTQVIVTAGPCALPGSGVVYIDSVSRGRTGRDAAYSYDPPEEANLSVSGTAEPGSAPLGSNLCYFITVSNSGPATATGVKATNTLPHQLLFMDVSSSDCIFTNQEIYWNIGTLPVHSYSTITISASIPLAHICHITNVSRVNGKQGDPFGHNNICTQKLVVDRTLDYNIHGTPVAAGAPAPFGYGHHRVAYGTVITNRADSLVQVTDDTRYRNCGYGSSCAPDGTNRECILTLLAPASLTWKWGTEYRLTARGIHGSVEGLDDTWACTNWIFDLYPVAGTDAVFSHWRINDQPAGNTLKLTITADAPYRIEAVCEISDWSIRSTGLCTRVQWDIGPQIWGTFEVCNPTDSGLLFTGACLFAITPHTYMHLALPDGTTPDGREYIDITGEIQAALPLTGNHDQAMDPGECVTLAPIEFLGKNPVYLDAYFLAEGVAQRSDDEDTDGDGLPNTWEDAGGLNRNNPDDAQSDTDGDGLTAREEYLADTHPGDPGSCLAINGILDAPPFFSVQWKGGILATQYLQEADTLHGPWRTLYTNIPPTDISNAYPRIKQTHLFYRIEAGR